MLGSFCTPVKRWTALLVWVIEAISITSQESDMYNNCWLIWPMTSMALWVTYFLITFMKIASCIETCQLLTNFYNNDWPHKDVRLNCFNDSFLYLQIMTKSFFSDFVLFTLYFWQLLYFFEASWKPIFVILCNDGVMKLFEICLSLISELENQIEGLRDTQKKYANILRLVRTMTSHFYHVVQTQVGKYVRFFSVVNKCQSSVIKSQSSVIKINPSEHCAEGQEKVRGQRAN